MALIDTHCHINIKRLYGKREEVVKNAQESGVAACIVPGIDLYSSKLAVELAHEYPGYLFAAVGMHPHAIHEGAIKTKEEIMAAIKELEALCRENPNIVAIGECGLDYFLPHSALNSGEKDLQQFLFKEQLKLAGLYHKPIIIHNREAGSDVIHIVNSFLEPQSIKGFVLHCCEPHEDLLKFIEQNNAYLGIDGDVTFSPEKQRFIKKVNLKNLLLETDAPFLLPEPQRSKKMYPNEPKYLLSIAAFVAQLKGVSVADLMQATSNNAKTLFNLPM